MKLKASIELWKELIGFRRNLRKLSIPRERSSGVVLSLTSIEKRLDTLHLPIIRLMKSGFRPDHVEIWLPETLKSQVTRELSALESRGCCLNFVQDIGPATKLMYCLGKHPHANIITVDDDVLLPHGSMQALVEKSKEYPGVVICNMARDIALSDSGYPRPYKEWKIMRQGSKQPEKAILPLGHGGVLYPSGSLSELYDRIDLMKDLCPTGDDLWFTAMRLLKEGKAYNTNHLQGRGIALPGTREHSIKNRNGAPGNNDSSIGKLFEKLHLQQKLHNS